MRHVRFAVLMTAVFVLSLSCAAPPRPAAPPEPPQAVSAATGEEGQAETPAPVAAAPAPAPAPSPAEVAPAPVPPPAPAPAEAAQAGSDVLIPEGGPETEAAPAPLAVAPALPLADPYAAAPAEARAAIAKAAGLMAAGNWMSAWQVLETADPTNADPFVLAQKLEVCVQGYVQSDGFRAFSFVDLQPGQSLAALRAGPGDYELIEFDPIAAAVALSETIDPLPPVLYAAIGDYYYEVQNLFPEQWFISDEEVCTRGLSCYEEAIAGGVVSASIYRREGELLIRFDRSPDAETRIRAALALDPSDPDAHFALAVAIAQQDRTDESYREVDAAVAGYQDADKRFSAYMLGARIASGADAARSEAYLASAEKEFPTEPSPALLRHSMAIQSGDAEAAEKAADAAFAKFPESPYVVRTILTNWIQSGDVFSAVAFLDKGLEGPGKDVSLGILGFYKALLTMEMAGPSGYAEAGTILDEAEARFHKAYPEDNQVFGAIAELRGRLAAPPEGDAEGEGGEAPTETTD